MEKVTEDVKVEEKDRIGSVMEMYRWLKEQVKEGADEEELERVWEEMKVMNKLP